MSKLHGLYEKLSNASSFEELIHITQNFESFRGLSLKHMSFLAENKSFVRDLLDDGFTLLDIKYALLNQQRPVHVICPVCNVREIHSTGFSYSKTCGDEECVRSMRCSSLKKTNLERYGVECVFSDKQIYEKGRKTREEKYGSNNNYAKFSSVIMSKYGVSCTWDIPGVRDKAKMTMNRNHGCDYALQSQDVREKSKVACLQKYGVEYPMQNKEIRDKSRRTSIERYGVTHPMKSSEVKERHKKSMMQHYGVDNNMKSDEGLYSYLSSIRDKYGKDFIFQTDMFKMKSQKTSLEKYGVKHPMQSKDVRDKQRTKYAYNGMTFDSSWELAFWIFCEDRHICLEHEPVKFSYIDNRGKEHTYFPDFRICGNILIELKGDDQFDISGKMIDKIDHSRDHIAEAKHQCMIKNNVVILRSKEMKPYLDYIDQKYGKGYLKQFKRKTNCGKI